MARNNAANVRAYRDREKANIAAIDDLLEVLSEGLDRSNHREVLDGLPVNRNDQIRFVADKLRGKRICAFGREKRAG